MRLLLPIAILVVGPQFVFARDVREGSPYDPPTGYYAVAEGLLGTSLKSALHQRILGHQVLAYGSSGTVSALRVLDAMPGDASLVQLLYWSTGRSAANYGGGTGQWNHEHCWPQSYGVRSGPGNSDLFNLRPCDVQANAERGNFYYAEIAGGTVPAYAPLCRKTSAQWMPRPEEKGDLARAMFYMAVRYEGGEVTPDLELSDSPNASVYRFGKLSDLLRWHREDPVTEAERRRNHVIYTDYQKNRNPFIDDPDYAEMVFTGVPVVHMKLVRAIAIEGDNAAGAAMVEISRRGPVTGDLVVLLQYGGRYGASVLASPPAYATIPDGASSVALLFSAPASPGLQGERALTVAVAPGAVYVAFDDAVALSVMDAPDNSFDAWADSFGLAGSEAAPGADPDADGFANLAEYAFGGDPAVGASGIMVASLLPQNDDWLAITAVVRTNDPGLTVLGETVTELSHYVYQDNIVFVSGLADGVDQSGVPEGCQRQIFSTPRSSEAAKFLRLQATMTNR